MPQLDLLIILNQFKVFVFIFLLLYIFFLLFSLPVINNSLSIRKYKISNIIKLFELFKSFRSFLFFRSKYFFDLFFDKNLFNFGKVSLSVLRKFMVI